MGIRVMNTKYSHLTVVGQLKLVLFICSILFLPSKDEWYRYYIVVNLVLPLLLLVDFSSKVTDVSKRVLLWLTFFILATLIKVVVLPASVSALREFTEFFRILIFTPILFIKDRYFNSDTFKLFLVIFCAYFLVDFYVTLNEVGVVKSNFIISSLKSIYHSKAQQNLNYLAKGLSSHGAEHGLILNFILVIIICMMKFSKQKWIVITLLLMALLSLIASGSKTSMIGFVFILIVYYCVTILKEQKKIPISAFVVFSIIIFGTMWALESGKFVRMEILFNQGTNSSSYQAREENWSFFLKIMEEYIYMFPVGWGKSIFMIEGKTTFFTDNEYLTFLIIHGVIVVAAILFYLLRYIVRIYRRWNKTNFYEKLLFLLLIDFLFIGLASLSFSSPKILLLLFFLYRYSTSKNIINQPLITKPT